jgi:hypothetical protein
MSRRCPRAPQSAQPHNTINDRAGPLHAECVPFSYVVVDVSSTVTFSPAEVTSSKPDLDTPLTLPIDPPAAAPDRALDSPPPDPDGAPCAAVVVEVVAAISDE